MTVAMLSPQTFLLRNNFFGASTVLLGLAISILGYICFDGLSLMVSWWERDEYSHGYMIPAVAAFLAWQKWPLLQTLSPVPVNSAPSRRIRSTWLTIPVLLVALSMFLMGELSGIYTLVQYSFLLGCYALVIAGWGVRGAFVMWAPLLYFVFMVPLPNYLYFNLSQQLQLISSGIGVAFLRLIDISVFLEGNIIDLGTYKLQVAEACDGLRYLFSLNQFQFFSGLLVSGASLGKGVGILVGHTHHHSDE